MSEFFQKLEKMRAWIQEAFPEVPVTVEHVENMDAYKFKIGECEMVVSGQLIQAWDTEKDGDVQYRRRWMENGIEEQALRRARIQQKP